MTNTITHHHSRKSGAAVGGAGEARRARGILPSMQLNAHHMPFPTARDTHTPARTARRTSRVIGGGAPPVAALGSAARAASASLVPSEAACMSKKWTSPSHLRARVAREEGEGRAVDARARTPQSARARRGARRPLRWWWQTPRCRRRADDAKPTRNAEHAAWGRARPRRQPCPPLTAL